MLLCWHYKLLLLLLMLCMATLQNAVHAREIEQLEKDSRYISYQDLLSTAKRYYEPETSSYSELLFDVARNQVIVGARDQLFRMSFDLELLERASWEATPKQVDMCQEKGQSEQLCRNYMRVLLSDGENQLYACGTNAFAPSCTWRQMENLTVLASENGVGKCPFNPHENITSLMTSRGRLFVGLATDFSGSDAAIIRTDMRPQLQEPKHNPIIRTKQYNNNWLNNPQFVGSFEAGRFVYFLFRESAMEYINCGKVVYSRIGRVCKNDLGGDMMLRDNWTSFLKARLNCSLPGEYPFYFNEIQGMTYSSQEDVLYATFTTADNSIYGSAICAYNLSAINAAFEGPFKHQEGDSAWRPVRTSQRGQFECQSSTAANRHKQLLESSRYQLMDEAVQPLTQKPLYTAELKRFTHIALDTVFTKTEQLHVLYVATRDNQIRKLSIKRLTRAPTPLQTCLVEAWQFSEPGAERILNMAYLKETDSLFVGTDLALTSIPAQRCSRHVSQTSCLNAMDPYCGWNELAERCTPQQMGAQMRKFWLQPERLACPVLNAPIDGAWSSWSDWFRCKKHRSGSSSHGGHSNSSHHGDDDEGDCLCRTRECNNPRPQNGGGQCEGITTEVQNCTVHGGWTEWSAWSACTQTCGIAVKIRRRTCGNPKPAHGGRTCVGNEHNEMYCSHLPPCPAPKPPAIDGSWGPWGEWSECSALCGSGYRLRRRECNDPSPLNGGAECPGCSMDYELCNTQPCAEARKYSAWTPWLVQQNESDDAVDDIARSAGEHRGTHVERRFRFGCRANTADANSVRITLAREETRLCRADGSCHRQNSDSGGNNLLPPTADSEHEYMDANNNNNNNINIINNNIITNEWSACSAHCGGGEQQRLHEGGKHRGRFVLQRRRCNTQPCATGSGGDNDNNNNNNNILMQSLVESASDIAHGWGAWSEWSACSADGVRVRHRRCLLDKPSADDCIGPEYEKADCTPGACDGGQNASVAAMTSIGLFICLGYAASIAATFYLTRRRYRPLLAAHTLRNSNATSPAPGYDSYPNQYSSLPTKDIYDVRPKVKRQSSFNMCSPSKYCNAAGTLTRNNINHNHTPKVLAKTYNDCETGTLKRNSNALNNQRSNLDDEKF